MKSSTKHSLERWVERIVGIETKKERDDYIRDNREQLNENMNKTFEFAQFIYKGQIGDNTTKNYYIQGNIIFVLNTTDDAFVTVFKVDFNFTPELNLQVAKGLVEEIHKLVSEKEDIDLKVLEVVEAKLAESELRKVQINALEQQLAILKKDKLFIDESIKRVNSDSLVIDLEIKKFTNMLVNSKEYREDLKTM